MDNGCCAGGLIPSNDGINNIISLLWIDCQLNNANDVKYQTVGGAPNRRFVISFDNSFKYFGEAPIVQGQIVLHETTNIVEIIAINTPPSSKTRALGIEDSSGTIGYSPMGFNASSSWNVSNTTFRYTPFNSCANISYNWSNLGNGFSANTQNTNDPKHPLGDSEYIFTATHSGIGRTKTIKIPYQISTLTIAGTLSNDASLCYGNNYGYT